MRRPYIRKNKHLLPRLELGREPKRYDAVIDKCGIIWQYQRQEYNGKHLFYPTKTEVGSREPLSLDDLYHSRGPLNYLYRTTP